MHVQDCCMFMHEQLYLWGIYEVQHLYTNIKCTHCSIYITSVGCSLPGRTNPLSAPVPSGRPSSYQILCGPPGRFHPLPRPISWFISKSWGSDRSIFAPDHPLCPPPPAAGVPPGKSRLRTGPRSLLARGGRAPAARHRAISRIKKTALSAGKSRLFLHASNGRRKYKHYYKRTLWMVTVLTSGLSLERKQHLKWTNSQDADYISSAWMNPGEGRRRLEMKWTG